MASNPIPLKEALVYVRRDGWIGREFEICFSAATLMHHCEDEQVTIGDMLRCLGIPGVVSEFGARCLYVRTGRDSLGWETAIGREFVTSRENWEEYLDSIFKLPIKPTIK